MFGSYRGPSLPPEPDIAYTPLYPAFLAGVMALDHRLADDILCYLDHNTSLEALQAAGCDKRYGGLIAVQLVLAALALVLVWLTARAVTGSEAVAWVALVLALLSGRHVFYANHFLTENLVLPLLAAAGLVLVLAWQQRERRVGLLLFVLAGALLGLATLTRPVFLYLAVVLALGLAGFALWRRPRPRRLLAGAAGLGLGCALVLFPWILRNAVEFGKPVVSQGYGGHTLAQRVAYNRMSWGEVGVAFLYWLPDFGDTLAAALFPERLYQRLTFDHPDSFYIYGNYTLQPQSLAAAGGEDRQVGYLVREHILTQPLRHTATTLALAWRGMFIAKYWGLITILAFTPVFVLALRRGWGTMILLALPPWFMVGVHAFLSVSVQRYNLILIPCLATATAWGLVWLYRRGWRRGVVSGLASLP